jgi:hypothetical protein
VYVAPLNEPLASVVVLPPRARNDPPKVAVIVSPALKPAPLTETVLPAGAVVGVSVICGVIVKVPVAVLGVGVAESSTSAVSLPAAPAGTR